MEASRIVRDRLLHHSLLATLIAIALGVSLGAQSADVKRDNDLMQKSLNAITARANTPPVAGKTLPPLRTTFTDTQFNAWLLLDGKDNVPVGLLQPRVTFLPAGKVTAKAIVDLDAVRKSKSRGMLDPMNLLTGLMPISLTGTLSGTGGMATFDVESASLGTWPLPRAVLAELLAYYSKSPEYPDGIALGKPFPLPSGVKSLIIARGTATVVQ
jgi:hypothetical protein